MPKGVFIVGTDTDVGKTVVTAGLLHVLRSNGYDACYFKAALSGATDVEDKLIPGDTKLVCEVSDLKEPYENITPYVFRIPVSPHLAAKLEINPIQIEVIREKFYDLKSRYHFILAEGSGGIVCPLIDGENGVYTLGNLIADLHMDVIIVARANLGTINHTVLTVKYIESMGIKIKGIIINNYEENLHCDDNIKMIEKLTNVPIIGKFKRIEEMADNFIKAIRKNADQAITVEAILDCLESI